VRGLNKHDELMALEGDTVTLSCKYSGSIQYFYWYQQKSSSSPHFLIREYSDETGKFSVKHNKEQKEFHVKISSAAVTDSAVYYCAVEPTVTGNNKTLYKILQQHNATHCPLVGDKHYEANTELLLMSNIATLRRRGNRDVTRQTLSFYFDTHDIVHRTGLIILSPSHTYGAKKTCCLLNVAFFFSPEVKGSSYVSWHGLFPLAKKDVCFLLILLAPWFYLSGNLSRDREERLGLPLEQGWQTRLTPRAQFFHCESQRATPHTDLPRCTHTNMQLKPYYFP
uniref:Ig-like domain-containing protein n=1 Tax=Oryzias latipes TaxID=8090 RepID=A0A3P9L3F9_ORYLA